ncbi:MAG: tRNA (N6-threonylcarbamoyladenosine(37)-N6)-methyltransferase TrmO [Thermodesulfobacteriota bacterium]|nr:tRNA (N6-threonylcarbamoyladenosine(37)-N6)-methyltransferase TrmO [Thermodesulfobacteriota bacterium]
MSEKESNSHTVSEIILRPVGVVRNRLKKPTLAAGPDDIELSRDTEAVKKRVEEIQDLVSEIVIDNRLEGILDGIEDFSHILVLYWPHQVADQSRTLTRIHPMGRKDFPLVGVFATCSPARPNPVLVTAVRFLERNQNVLKVQGLEAIDGSPVIDIKPYNPHYYFVENVKLSQWMIQIMEEIAEE